MFTTDVGTINADYPVGIISAADGAMTVGDLHGILTASEGTELRRLLFHPDLDLGASEWRVISGLCGKFVGTISQRILPSSSKKPSEFSR